MDNAGGRQPSVDAGRNSEGRAALEVEDDMQTLDQEEPGGEILVRSPFQRPKVTALRNIIATLVVGAIIVGLVLFFDRPGASSQSISLTATASGPPPKVGQQAPDFTARDLEGKPVKLSDFKGRPVWLNFWATWCPPCRAENPDIEAVYQANKDKGLVVLAVSIGEGTGTVRDYVNKTGLSYNIALDQTTEAAATYRIVGIPTHFFIDPEGILREWRIGSLSEKTMKSKVEEIMGGGAP